MSPLTVTQITSMSLALNSAVLFLTRHVVGSPSQGVEFRCVYCRRYRQLLLMNLMLLVGPGIKEPEVRTLEHLQEVAIDLARYRAAHQILSA